MVSDDAGSSGAEIIDLGQRFVHLGLGATVVPQPAFTGLEWYEGYGERHADDGTEGRLVSMHTFTEPWDSWEVHPRGEELVVCTAGELVLHQDLDDGVHQVVLIAGQAVVNPRRVWHTADCAAPVTALFITAGEGTEHRPR